VSDPKRLSAGEDLGAALLGSARSDAPRAASRARTAAALGLGAGVALGAVAGSAVAKAAGASVAPKAVGGAGLAAKAANAVWLKLLAGGVVALAVAGGVGVKLTTSAQHVDATIAEHGRAPIATSAPLGAGSAPRATGNAEETTSPEVPAPPAPPSAAIPGAAAAEPPRAVPRALPMTPASTATASTAPESPLARELRSLDEARSTLADGDPSGALAALDRHDRAFATGPLRTEANILRVEALLARGDRAAARKLARALLARDPASPHARRLRTIADDAL